MKQMTITRTLILGLLVLIVPLFASAKEEASINHRARQMEAKADRAFIRGDYDKAMIMLSDAGNKITQNTPQKLDLELKMARLYTLLQDPVEMVNHYGAVVEVADTMLSINDVCFYIDALRQLNRIQQAEVVARRYAFKSPYSRNQRYLNTLHSLSNVQHYFGRGDSDYAVKLMDINTAHPEYWLGKWNDDIFYAVSNSRIQDPLKIYYHQTQYYSLASEIPAPLRSIPREMQSGPVAFADNNKLMVATGISYRRSDKIRNISGGSDMFVTQLYFSVADKNRAGWRRFEPLFEHQDGYNYAHPAFFNGGKSLVFSSDRSGGYGGMDLYVAHWNETDRKWSDPINMGPAVNTEGDEIFPRIIDDQLYFASNGLEGFGGYDIFMANIANNRATPGTLYHYPYPINSAANDFGIFFNDNTGYFISDRRGFAGKDDIYTFDPSISPLNSQNVIGVSDETSAMTGNLRSIQGLRASNTKTLAKDMSVTPSYVVPAIGEVMLSVYFDFNSSKLNAASVSELRSLLRDPALNDIKELYILGYADELGTQQYNIPLSERRADAVAQAMCSNAGNLPKLFIEGRGQLTLSPEEYTEAVKQAASRIEPSSYYEIRRDLSGLLSFDERVKLNSKLRRVDIIVKKK